MNGDNDLSEEVLHALDMMETVGSSDRVNVIALVDGHEQYLGTYAPQWAKARMVRVTSDSRIGSIESEVLEEWGESNLGSPETLAKFIRRALRLYPADRYFFYTFAHSQGVIDTRRFFARCEPGAKTVSFSQDATSNDSMRLEQFEDAVHRGLGSNRFDLMVLFSCLANMVEVGYTLSDVTDYLVGSEDEIRLLNKPAGSFQLRGLPFETFIEEVKASPGADSRMLGQSMVDAHVNAYGRDVSFTSEDGMNTVCRFSAGMSLIDCSTLPSLVSALDHLARLLIRHSGDPGVVHAMQRAFEDTQRFASFLNLEYFDLKGFLFNLRTALPLRELAAASGAAIDLLVNETVLYERHTPDCGATGLSIYLSNPLVPDNIYQAHRDLYKQNRFSRKTQWDEMIDIYRKRLKR